MNFTELKNQFEKELTDNILNFWINKVYDAERKTFFGRISNNNEKFPDDSLSAVLVTRILWTFSAVYRVFPAEKYKNIADEAFRILLEIFWDNQNGGIFWSVNPGGSVVDSKKQFYAQAFLVYALSEYHLAFHDEKSKQLAISMFMIIERFGFDKDFDGYFEANTKDWQKIGDQRLSEKDMNVEKSMNTHLHVLEAYTNLYRFWKDETLKNKLEKIIHIFLEKIVNHQTFHFELFFDADWKERGNIDSYGHDIEGSWLLLEAAEVLGDKKLVKEIEAIALKMADITEKEGIVENGGLLYEKENGKLKEEFHWWSQAEAIVGFFNAWQISKNEKYLNLALNNWEFIQKYIVDKKNGEWFWGINRDYQLLSPDKVNGWKAPYHNSRMCLEMIHRIQKHL